MRNGHAATSTRARSVLALGSTALFVLSVGLSASAGGATPSAASMRMAGVPSTTTGEGEPGGPIIAPVDPAHATVAAARGAALAAHDHHHVGTASSSTAAGAQTTAAA